MEIQDRGSPHIHMVLWTGKTSNELITSDDIVCCRIPDAHHDEELHHLVTSLQIHQCGPYCLRQNHLCRFGFPKEPSEENGFCPMTLRAFYKRSGVDAHVNNYNPYLLKLMKCSMDIQINSGHRVLPYLAKYLSKPGEDEATMDFHMETAHDHFQARVVGAVDAAFFVLGMHKHQSSRGVVFISTTFPGKDERRQLKDSSRLATLPEDSTDIFTATHVQKYLKRHHQLEALTMPEYFTTYFILSEMDIRDTFDDDNPTIYGQISRATINAQEQQFYHPELRKSIPKQCTDQFGRRYKARAARTKLPLWRTHQYAQSEGEAFFYQQMMLYYAMNQTDHDELLRTHGSWRQVFLAVCDSDRFQMDSTHIEDIKRYCVIPFSLPFIYFLGECV